MQGLYIALIYMIEKLGYLSYDEFTYLLPLCKTKYDVKKMIENIKANRMGLNINEIIKMKIFEMNNYLEELAVKNSNRANELGIENMKLKNRIDKAIEYMNNTYDISDLKELFEHYNNIEKILKGEENE